MFSLGVSSGGYSSWASPRVDLDYFSFVTVFLPSGIFLPNGCLKDGYFVCFSSVSTIVTINNISGNLWLIN